MLFLEFFQWWYGDGWRDAAKNGIGLVNKVQLTFSIPVLLSTLFSPWRRIITSPGRSLDDKMRALLDNLVSRAVGFFVRLFSLIAALVLALLAAVAGGIIALAWPFVPLIIIVCFWKALI
jgi:hypothetical protein